MNNFSADVFDGRATGNARVAIGRGGSSQVTADFTNVDIAGPLTALAGSAVPLSGRATGRVDLTFPGTDVKLATGTITTQLTAATGQVSADNIPITGTVALRADRGLFDIQQVNLQTPATKLSATGQFSFENDSNLQVDLASTDAAELQAVLISSGLLPDVEEQLRSYGIGLAGQLAFNGNIRGRLNSPDVNGKFSLGSLIVNGIEVGALSASVAMNEKEIRVTDGQLSERDGGGVRFSLTSLRDGENGTSLEATLDRFSAKTLLALAPSTGNQRLASDTEGDLVGTDQNHGYSERDEWQRQSRAWSRSTGGRAAGRHDRARDVHRTKCERGKRGCEAGRRSHRRERQSQHGEQSFRLSGQGTEHSTGAARGASQTGRDLSSITGAADLTARVSGKLTDEDFSNYQITFDGEGRDVMINGRSAGTVALKGRTENQQLSITFTTGLLGQPQVVAAQINLASDVLPATIETTLTNADLTNLFQILMPNTAGVRIAGRANGTIKASGNLVDDDEQYSLAGLSGTANFTELSFRVEDIQLAATTPLVINFTPNEVAFQAARFTGPGSNIVLDGTIASGAGGATEFECQRRPEPARAERYLAGLLLVGHGRSRDPHQRHFRRPARDRYGFS